MPKQTADISPEVCRFEDRVQLDAFASELTVKSQELDKFQKAFKDEKFRALFNDYVEEISDPKNKELYEKEITALEAERGNDIRWLRPTAGFVIKTRFSEPPPPPKLDSLRSSVEPSMIDSLAATWPKEVKKAFVNMCHSTEVGKAECKKVVGSDGKPGESWSIPYSLGLPRVELDKEQKECIVYDCCFHSDIFSRTANDKRFLDFLSKTAIEGIERQYVGVKLQRDYVVLKKLKVKGEIKPTVIRTPSATKPMPNTTTEYLSDLQSVAKKSSKSSTSSSASTPATAAKKPLIQSMECDGSARSRALPVPSHKVNYSNTLSYQSFTNPNPAAPPLSVRPQKLTVTVDYPSITTAADLDVDVTHDAATAKSNMLLAAVPGKFAALNVRLPFQCVEGSEVAKFEKAKCRLVVTFDVVPAPELPPILGVGPVTAEEILDEQKPLDKGDPPEEQRVIADTNTVTKPQEEAVALAVESNQGIGKVNNDVNVEIAKKEDEMKGKKRVSFADSNSIRESLPQSGLTKENTERLESNIRHADSIAVPEKELTEGRDGASENNLGAKYEDAQAAASAKLPQSHEASIAEFKLTANSIAFDLD